MKLGKELRQRRMELGLVMTDMATSLNISLPDYSDIEHGRRVIESEEMISKLSELLNIPRETIFLLNSWDKNELEARRSLSESASENGIILTKGAHPWGFVD